MFVLTVKKGDFNNGCIINTVIQAAEKPEYIAFSVNKLNYTENILQTHPFFTVSVINTQADFSLFKRFGFASGKNTDKFAGFNNTFLTPNGTLAVTMDTNAYIYGKVCSIVNLGSHSLFTAKVSGGKMLNNIPTLTYDYYRKNIKPTPNTAEKQSGVWRCEICGFEYTGTQLPPDYICPVCKHSANFFEKIN